MADQNPNEPECNNRCTQHLPHCSTTPSLTPQICNVTDNALHIHHLLPTPHEPTQWMATSPATPQPHLTLAILKQAPATALDDRPLNNGKCKEETANHVPNQPPQPRNSPQKGVPLSPQLCTPQHKPPVPTASPPLTTCVPPIPTALEGQPMAPTPLIKDLQPQEMPPPSHNEKTEQ